MISEKTMRCLKLMRDTGCKLLPTMGPRKGERPYMLMSGKSTRVDGEITINQFDDCINTRLLNCHHGGLYYTLDNGVFDEWLEKIKKKSRSKAKSSGSSATPTT